MSNDTGNKNEISTIQKAFIGAAGGFSLVLLKLIEQSFFVGAPEAKILIGYLTYAAYIALGMIVAAFLTDHELSKEKGKKQALIMGLLAPSILIAIITNPDVNKNYTKSVISISKVPDLGFNFSIIGTAHAQDKYLVDNTQNKKVLEVKVLNKSDVVVGYKEAFLSVIGRKEVESKYALVIGSSKNKARAKKVAMKLNSALSCNEDSNGDNCAELISVKTGGPVYVTLGGLRGIESANLLKLEVLNKIINSKKWSNNDTKNELASLVSKGQIVEGIEFLE